MVTQKVLNLALHSVDPKAALKGVHWAEQLVEWLASLKAVKSESPMADMMACSKADLKVCSMAAKSVGSKVVQSVASGVVLVLKKALSMVEHSADWSVAWMDDLLDVLSVEPLAAYWGVLWVVA
jgi:hypothetical protein